MFNPTEAQHMRIIEDLKTLVRDAHALIQDTANDHQASSLEIKKSMTHKLNQAMEQLHHLEHCHREHLIHSTQKAHTYITNHPMQAVGISAAVGLMLGLLIKRN